MTIVSTELLNFIKYQLMSEVFPSHEWKEWSDKKDKRIKVGIRDRIQCILSYIPGTSSHAERKVSWFFSSETFDHEELTTSEVWLLDESKDDKYIPAIQEWCRSRYQWLLIWALAPYEFLLIWIVLLSASANSTTWAWYSITLKEMKEKFEGMWLSLTSRLLSSDVSANALATYAGIGFAYKKLIYDSLIEFSSKPDSSSFIRFISGVWVTALIHTKLEKILANKEQASIQFDFNDATLAWMTEEQQKFFSKSINEVSGQLDRLRQSTSDIEMTRSILWVSRSLIELIRVFDIENLYDNNFKNLEQTLSAEEDNYTWDIPRFLWIMEEVFWKILTICNFSTDVKDQVQGKIWVLHDKTNHSPDIVQSLLNDIVPVMMKEIERFWEKIIKKEAS